MDPIAMSAQQERNVELAFWNQEPGAAIFQSEDRKQIEKDRRYCQGIEKGYQSRSNLSFVSLEPIEHRLERSLAEAAIDPCLDVILITFTQALGAIVEGVSKGFVDTFEGVAASHEDLEG